MSLLAVGAQDQYLTVSPQMSYFKQVYQRPTNFGMQSIKSVFSTNPVLGPKGQTFTCQIGRYGDLLKDIALGITLPAIYSNDTLRFRWTNNISKYMMNTYTCTIDTQQIDQRWGEWMDIWNELSLSFDKKTAFDNLSGNVQTYMNPVAPKPMVIIKNNRIAFSYYPVSTGPNDPSIPARAIYIPLDFWFCKNPSLALPLIGLQYQVVNVIISFRSIEDLYQVWNASTGMYMSPTRYNDLSILNRTNAPKVSIGMFTQFGGGGLNTVDIKASLDVNYVFLDSPERTYIAGTSIDYLVEQVSRNDTAGVVMQTTNNLILSNPIKEMIWVLRRSDANLYNDWSNFTASQPADTSRPPLVQGKMIWNGLERFEMKPFNYFNQLVPYQCHASCPREGIYCYSFALNPERLQPSGSFNATMVSSIQLQLSMNPFTTTTTPHVASSGATEYELITYALQYNVFRMLAGRGSMVFTL